jgi:catechol 2,3-dioxygenase-like lactoylglutathione lyase family enzyme
MVRARRLGWLGVRTDKFDEMVSMLRDVLGLSLQLETPGRAMFKFDNGDPVDIFDLTLPQYSHFTTGPVVGFVVDNVEQAAIELARLGLEVGEVKRGDGFVWAHFRGPDGNLYEVQGTELQGIDGEP